MSYNFEESCLLKKQISGDLLRSRSEGRIELEDDIADRLERIQSGSYSAMSIDRILELADDHGIYSELRNEEDLKKIELYNRKIEQQQEEKGIFSESKKLEASIEFSEKNKDKKLHVFLIKESRMEIDGWGNDLSDAIEHYIYVTEKSTIDFKKELEKSTEWKIDSYDGELELIKKGKNSFTFTVENDEEPWEVYTYTLVDQKEFDLPILMELLGGSGRFFFDIKSLILDESIIEKDITDSQKNLLFFDPSELAKEVSKNLKDLKPDQVNILMDEIKKILGV
jgi:hypothetical protein